MEGGGGGGGTGVLAERSLRSAGGDVKRTQGRPYRAAVRR